METLCLKNGNGESPLEVSNTQIIGTRKQNEEMRQRES